MTQLCGLDDCHVGLDDLCGLDRHDLGVLDDGPVGLNDEDDFVGHESK